MIEHVAELFDDHRIFSFYAEGPKYEKILPMESQINWAHKRVSVKFLMKKLTTWFFFEMMT